MKAKLVTVSMFLGLAVYFAVMAVVASFWRELTIAMVVLVLVGLAVGGVIWLFQKQRSPEAPVARRRPEDFSGLGGIGDGDGDGF